MIVRARVQEAQSPITVKPRGWPPPPGYLPPVHEKCPHGVAACTRNRMLGIHV
ncbi:unnamed protein product [Periconia digitata]|uniref:Uncharacterized protein n=1 Tax=Periconia digitata TaxID=1303443 RepID=A0A9W4XR11_9PLEO|nr:unnamed protein product [Periconia digitata]